MDLKSASLFIILLAIGCKYLYTTVFSKRATPVVELKDHYPGQCRQVPGIQCGSEKISVTKDGLAFITNGFKGLTRCNPAYTPGRIYLFDFNHPDNNVVALEIDSSTLEALTFDPHGMDIIEDGESVKLFVVNHGNGGETVEKFVFNRREPTTLKHVDTIRDEKFVCINDVVMVTENEFYITNTMKSCIYASFLAPIELSFQLHTANVVHYKSGKTTVVASGPGFNGLTLSKDMKKLLVASISTIDVYVYDVQPGALSFNQVVPVGYVSDNIHTDGNSVGHVYIAAIIKQVEKVYDIVANVTDAMPSTVVRITANDDWSKVDIEEVFQDSGRYLVTGVSSAVHFGKQYLFGTVFHNLAHCTES